MKISSLFAKLAKDDASSPATIGDYHAPPHRHDLECRGEMTWRGNQGCPIDNFAIRRDLMRQAIQGIGLGLDFEAADMPVDYSDIDTTGTVAKTQFVDDQGVGTCTRMP